MGWWFGRKSAPADVRPFVPAWLSVTEAEEGFARSYDAQFDEVYRKNPVGQRAVRLVAGMLGALPVFAAEGDAEAAKLVSAGGLLETLSAHVLLHGNAYVQLLADGRDVPSELCLLRPERVSVISDERGWPVGYLYRGGGQTVRIGREDALGRRQVAHVRALNPRDDHYGMGCIEAAIAPASVHNRASRWNKALLDNAARPSGALSYEPADGMPLSADQFARLKEELANEFSGAGNAGRPLLLEGGLKWQAMSLTPADMDFVALKEGAARDIALAFGVPPVLVGLPGDATYANAREAGRALYRQTILPMAARILDELSGLLSEWLGPVRLAVDTDQLSELAEDRARLWDVVGAATFLSDQEKRPFEDVLFPIEIGAEASVAPNFSTNIVTAASGYEARNVNWAQARLRFDAGPGVRGDGELETLLAFYRARRGPAVGFRFRDPYDHSSKDMTGAPVANDQRIGTGDGVKQGFALIKTYGVGEERRITRPVAGSVRVAVNGSEMASGWSLLEQGVVQFATPPAAGAAVAAGYQFDTPVRFADDRLEINRATFAAGEAPSVPLIEIREG